MVGQSVSIRMRNTAQTRVVHSLEGSGSTLQLLCTYQLIESYAEHKRTMDSASIYNGNISFN